MTICEVFKTYAFPLILIGVGALLTQWLIPNITQKWQNNQKALEIKTDIITELIQLLMTILVNGDDYYKAKEGDKENVKKTNEKMEKYWLIRKCVIGSKLHAYFPDNKHGKWELHDYFSEVLTNNFINYSLGNELLIEPDEPPTIDEDLNTSEGKRDYLLRKKAELIQEILKIDAKEIAFLQGKNIHSESKQAIQA